ncbi:MAG: hypothetical protein EZS28_018207 [Streblomastix strix]|uniref:Uncharacterized protein n=1 Tax=Streblomastix strix TaxID=222440 RepID=A0A5J4VV37_9EUKA|nr:MAG: hypothetical protein EZS28_018207 [Streblomastix strix]
MESSYFRTYIADRIPQEEQLTARVLSQSRITFDLRGKLPGRCYKLKVFRKLSQVSTIRIGSFAQVPLLKQGLPSMQQRRAVAATLAMVFTVA